MEKKKISSFKEYNQLSYTDKAQYNINENTKFISNQFKEMYENKNQVIKNFNFNQHKQYIKLLFRSTSTYCKNILWK